MIDCLLVPFDVRFSTSFNSINVYIYYAIKHSLCVHVNFCNSKIFYSHFKSGLGYNTHLVFVPEVGFLLTNVGVERWTICKLSVRPVAILKLNFKSRELSR